MAKSSKYWSNKVTYRRKKWTDKRIDKEKRKGNIIIRAKDVGRPKKHFIRNYYYTPSRPNLLVKTTFRKYKG